MYITVISNIIYNTFLGIPVLFNPNTVYASVSQQPAAAWYRALASFIPGPHLTEKIIYWAAV
jgi:hypothetical protein